MQYILDPYVCLWSWLFWFCLCLYLDFCLNVVVLSQLWYAISVNMIDFDCQQVKSIGTLFESDYLLSFCLFMYVCLSDESLWPNPCYFYIFE